MSWSVAESMALSARLVAIDGQRWRLKGEERTLAIRLMAERGIAATEMAARLDITTATLYTWAKERGIQLPRKEAHWTMAYMDREYGIRRKRNQR